MRFSEILRKSLRLRSLDKGPRYGMMFPEKGEIPVKKFMIWIVLLFLLLPLSAQATEAPVEIYTPEDLAAIAEDPTGSYILMNDLDMSGIAWQSIDFQGTLDGNGYAILNLSPALPGKEHPACYDGNRRPCEPDYYGLFSTLTNATVKNLSLLNVRALVETDNPAYLAGLAGYSDGSTVTGCTVTGTLELRAHKTLIGLAGIIGYGNGTVEDCQVDMTMISVDTDDLTWDEQFMGGIFGHGLFDVRNCTITIDGYVSECGYCHNGGIGGMHMIYPQPSNSYCEFGGNTVTGKITFFENNWDRRAYCYVYIGEYLDKNYLEYGNSGDFLRDEKWQYDKELRPCMCQEPVYAEEVTPSDCRDFGYTTHTCQSCGYAYRDAYTLKVHTPGTWQVTKEPTTEETGEQAASCVNCDYLFTEILETLPPETTAEITPPTETMPETTPAEPVESEAKGNWTIPLAVAAVAVVAGILLLILRRQKQNGGKFQH